MDRRCKKPFIVSWNHKRLKLSDGSHEKMFFNHDDAINFLEEERSKVQYVISTRKVKADYLEEYGEWPMQGQLQCTHEEGKVTFLYGVSEFYIIPTKHHVKRESVSKS